MTEMREDFVDPMLARELLAHRDFVQALARRLVRDPDAADDVTQETMTRLLEVGRPRSIRPWLQTVLRNVTLRFARRDRRRAEVESARAWCPPSTSPATDEIVQCLELERRLTALVLALEPRSRDVVLLHFYEGKTVAQVAARLGVPFETARTRLRRALVQLRSNWNAEFGGRHEGTAALAIVAQWSASRLLAPTTAVATSSAAYTGVIAMTTKTKLLAMAAVVLLAAGTVVLWPRTHGSNSSSKTDLSATLRSDASVVADASKPPFRRRRTCRSVRRRSQRRPSPRRDRPRSSFTFTSRATTRTPSVS